MAKGDIKGDEAVVIELTAVDAVAKGDVVHCTSASGWDQAGANDIGKFAVAIEASSNAVFRAVIWGRVEVQCASGAEAIPIGATAIAAASGKIAVQSFTDKSNNYGIGTVMDASSNSLQTIWVGLVN